MPDLKKIIENFQPSEKTANFFVLFKDENTSIDGWISLGDSLIKFISLIQEEIEYCWGTDHANMDDYIIFYIDVDEKNNLKEIENEKVYQKIRNLNDIFIVILHKEVKYRIIENLPLVFEWFMAYLP
ncbi:MAG: hypothetical protein ACFE8B_17120 [Candidatus Hermodarchaeota archaeon]